MTPDILKSICRDRFHRWTRRMVGEGATPLVTIGLCHGDKSGTLVLCTLEDDKLVSREFLAGALRWAAAQLDAGTVTEKGPQ